MWRRMQRLWRGLRSRRSAERELDEELRAYAELLTAEKLERGMDARAARRAALVEVGGMEQVKEEVRAMRAGALLDAVLQDLRYAWRALVRSPGFAVAAVLALALGVGATTAVFSVVDAVLLRPLPYADQDELVVLLHGGDDPVSAANVRDWRSSARSFEAMGAAEYYGGSLSGGDEPERVVGLRMTADVLPMLGVAPQLGRFFDASAETPGRDGEVLIGHALWQRRFGGDATVIGRELLLDGRPMTIVGVMPRGFFFAPFWATEAELWAPLALGERWAQRRSQSLRVFARLNEGVNVVQAQGEMRTIAARLEAEFPGTNRDVTVTPLKEKVVGDIRPALLVLLGAVAFVLLIACANVAHLLLARASGREREIAVRGALGASAGRMARQFLVENLLLASLGGGLGVVLAAWGVRFLVSLDPGAIPLLDTVGIDARVLAFSLLMTLVTGLMFGILPARHGRQASLVDALREGARGTTQGARRQRVRSVLVASEFALALMLLIGAGLMIRSFASLRSIDPGFEPGHMLSAVVSLNDTPQNQPERRALFYGELLERMRAMPGVEAAGVINHLPLAGDIWGFPFLLEDRPRPAPGETDVATYRVVFPGYFRAMRLPIVRGRDFADTDRLDAPGVVIVNQHLADLHWPGEDAIGKRIAVGALDEPEWLTVVGVAKDAVRGAWAERPQEEVYLPYLQTRMYLEGSGGHVGYLTFVVRTTGSASALAPALRRLVWSMDPTVPVSDVSTLQNVVSQATSRPRFNLLLLGTFAVVALALAAVGIYGVMSYSVSRRTHEIGIRMALGAHRAEVLRLIMGQAMKPALLGAAAGVAGALALTRVMGSLLYGVGSLDLLTFLTVPALLCAVAAVASWLPARRALRGGPLRSLRGE